MSSANRCLKPADDDRKTKEGSMLADTAYQTRPFRTGRNTLILLAALTLVACSGGGESTTTTTSNTTNTSSGGGQPNSPSQPGTPSPSDTANPVVTIQSPSGPLTTQSNSVTVSGNATDDIGVTQVTWSNRQSGVQIGSGTATGTLPAWQASIALQSGTNNITITAYDNSGKTGTATIAVTYNPPAPSPTPPGTGRNWYVDQNHANASDTDADAGTETKPFLTLTRAVDVVGPGETVIVRPGRYTDNDTTYYEAFTPRQSGTASSPITIKADPPRGAVLVPGPAKPTSEGPEHQPALSIHARSHIIVDGFTAEGMLMIHAEPPEGSVNVSRHVTIQNCDVVYGDKLGTDESLYYGILVHSGNDNIIRNNRVYNLRDDGNSNYSSNTAAIMLFASAYNIIENNDADADYGTVYSAYGQKAGNIHHNIWRRNIARNAVVGFLGKGGTNSGSYADDETYYENIIINTRTAFNLNHNSRRWKVYNNTAYNVDFFFKQWELNSVDNQLWNNIAVLAPESQAPPQEPERLVLGGPVVKNPPAASTRPRSFYNFEEDTTENNVVVMDWRPYLQYSNYNLGTSDQSVFARTGGSTYDLAAWRNIRYDGTLFYDQNTASGNPQFQDLTSFKLQSTSPARGAGRNGEDIGAYPNPMQLPAPVIGVYGR